MPIRLIVAILCVVFLAFFTGFNLDNRSNVWIFHTFENVPVFITSLVSFLVALVISLPLAFKKSRKITEEDVKKFEYEKARAEERVKREEAKKAAFEKKVAAKAEKEEAKKEAEKAAEEKIADEKAAENLAETAQ